MAQTAAVRCQVRGQWPRQCEILVSLAPILFTERRQGPARRDFATRREGEEGPALCGFVQESYEPSCTGTLKMSNNN